MKKIKDNVKGITLVSLIITIIVLLILLSIGTYSGIEVIKSSKFTKFTTEMKIMQTHVNDLYQKNRNGEKVKIGTTEYEILELGKNIDTVQAQADNVFTASTSGITDQTGYRYFDQETIENLNIEGIQEEFFINIEKRSVVSYRGLKYDDITYYTLEQIPSGLYNVDYEENTNIPEFKASVEAIEEGKWKILISDIEYDGYVSKWEVKYKLEGQENWNTTENMNFTIDEEGVYIVTVSNKDVTINEKRIAVGVKEIEPELSSITSLNTMLYGVIEIEFLDDIGYKGVKTPNEPILKDKMQAVYWSKDESGEIDSTNPVNNTYEMTSGVTNFKKGNWYKYLAQTGDVDGKTSRWANAITDDGSYYVWIPRYAYRIIYFDSQENENAYRAGTLTEEEALESGAIVGYSDARGIVDKDGKRPISITSTTSISINDKYFRTHPVFDGNPDEGGWDSKLAGIWVMKYEASRNDADETNSGNGIIPKSVPNVKAWTNTDMNTMFTYAKDAYNDGDTLNTVLNSHMMKNSEWGALVYLAESKYGRNGTEISINQCSSQITGTGRGLNSTESTTKTGTNTIYNSTYIYDSITEEQKYIGIVGQLSSTTGNIYGIYDISGGSAEYVMGFYGKDQNTLEFGESGFSTETYPKEKKYSPTYINSSDKESNADGGILGDATKETKSWNSDYAYFVYSKGPVFTRGSTYKSTSVAGTFGFYWHYGNADNRFTYRICLAIQ